MRTSEAAIEERSPVATGALESLLRTELAACEAYSTAVRAAERGSESPALALRCLFRMHHRFADEIRHLLPAAPETPERAATGVWAAVGRRLAGFSGRADGPAILDVLRDGERSSLELALRVLRDLPRRPADFVKGRYAPGLATNLELIAALATRAVERAEEDASPA